MKVSIPWNRLQKAQTFMLCEHSTQKGSILEMLKQFFGDLKTLKFKIFPLTANHCGPLNKQSLGLKFQRSSSNYELLTKKFQSQKQKILNKNHERNAVSSSDKNAKTTWCQV